jgi:hypothetical protein
MSTENIGGPPTPTPTTGPATTSGTQGPTKPSEGAFPASPADSKGNISGGSLGALEAQHPKVAKQMKEMLAMQIVGEAQKEEERRKRRAKSHIKG